jgi:hypothetical protein
MAKREKPLKEESLIIKFEHLNPKLQEVIGKKVRLREIFTGGYLEKNAGWIKCISIINARKRRARK